MVEDVDSQELSSFNQLFRDQDVLPAGAWVPGGVVMDHDDGGRGLQQGRFEYLPRVHDARVQAAYGHGFFLQDLIFRVQVQGYESLFLLLAHFWVHESIDVFGRADFSLGFLHKSLKPPCQFKDRRDL